MIYHHESGIILNQGFKLFHLQLTVLVEPNEVEGDEAFIFQSIERSKHGIVFLAGGDDVIPRIKQASNRDVQSFGGVLRKNHLAGIGCSK
ncbi:hypothetical protein SDC9_191780 [bioreactor metagenome]|uniref:Uncharacterized protein n=1 Tax=bioreactor metagenome TaxID=1076179 RepID=A0A645I1B4_9ZZZZ